MVCAHDWLPVLTNSNVVECTACGSTKLANVKDVWQKGDDYKKTKSKEKTKDHEH